MTPEVSVCIPAYNRRDMFRATLWSVLRQTYSNLEVIVSDNASDEDLQAEVAAAKDTRVRYYRREKNFGGPDNFFFLEAFPKGKYVVFLCSDDLLMPHCLARAVTAIEAQPQCGGAVYMAAHYNAEGFQFLSTMPERRYAAAPDYATDRAVRDFRFAAPSLCLYRRDTFESLGGWNRSLVAVGDWDLYAKTVRRGGGMVFVHEVLAIIRLHEARDSNTTALHWGFYHDVMLLASKPELLWERKFRARAVVEQLLWDWRLGRSPYKTLEHAYQTRAVGNILLNLPQEILRRVFVKLHHVFVARASQQSKPSVMSASTASFDRGAFDSFWRTSERIRLQGATTI
jgi:glycosyltransferase involved in cell wall biosynthesis